MTYRDTARRYARAVQSTRYGGAPDPAAIGADKLPLPTLTDRTKMSTRGIAEAHAAHVSDMARMLRDALALHDARTELATIAQVALAGAARALLAAIGEEA